MFLYPVYKEKLRLRSYGTPTLESMVYLEIKKKYKGVVYKRRASMTLEEAYAFLEDGIVPEGNTQILNELQYFIKFYQPVAKRFIAYDRIAMYGKEDASLRITFDGNIRSRNSELQLEEGDYGDCLFKEEERLMEIKFGGAMPVWLVQMLSELQIRSEERRVGKEC